MSRPETGPMQFGADWPGVFIRGDNAFHYAWALQKILDALDSSANPINVSVARGLVELLRSCDVGARDASSPAITSCRAFDACELDREPKQ